ncbi:MAG: metallophosphoesterase [Acetobacter sp.]|nr:metallophosphoesterase [Bacteroides sp.]MCM1340982.1 metallophosphoesterase [Acetobacter sp.]MCM1432462.1 metallophosphoesterase [Clostridiales bacterium]
MKILLVADVHNKPLGSRKTLASLKKVFNKTNPDLIVFLGDTVHGPSTKRNYRKYLRQVLDLTGNIPFATVFGNHDDECSTKKDEILEIISEYKNSLTNGRDYLVEMMGESLLFIDSGSYYDGEESYYDTVKTEQIDNALKMINGKKAIAFQHIIVPDIMDCIDVFEKKQKGAVRDGKKYYRFKENIKYTGFLGECPCPPDINTKELERLSPYLKAMCFGHDHKNSFELELMGVKLIQCTGSGSNSYDKFCKSSVKLLDTETLKTTQIFI